MPFASASGQGRLVAFAGASVALVWDNERGERIASFLFEHTSREADIAPCQTFGIRWIESLSRLGLYRGDTLIYLGNSEGHLAEMLMGEVCRHLVMHSRGGLLFHSAGLAHNGAGVMLPGAMTVGKSTLAAWLALQGLDYLTDELVYIMAGASEMQSLIRPLSLRQPSREALAEMGWAALAPSPWPSREGELAPPDALNPDGRWATPTVRLLIFPQYATSAIPAVSRLSQAETAMALLRCLVNSHRLPGGGLPEVARIARQVRGYAAVYGELSQLEGSLDEWLCMD